MPGALVKDRAAETDLIDIWVYSFNTWGEAQANRYLDAMELGIGQLARSPDAGDSRHALREGYWSKRIEHHIVFYTFTEDEVRVRRVLHEVMEVGRHL